MNKSIAHSMNAERKLFWFVQLSGIDLKLIQNSNSVSKAFCLVYLLREGQCVSFKLTQ